MNQWHIFHVIDKTTAFSHSSSGKYWYFGATPSNFLRAFRKIGIRNIAQSFSHFRLLWNAFEAISFMQRIIPIDSCQTSIHSQRRQVSAKCINRNDDVWIWIDSKKMTTKYIQRYESTTTEFRSKSLLQKMYPLLSTRFGINLKMHRTWYTNKDAIKHIS